MSHQIAAKWEGDGFTPLPRFRKECDKEFVIGETYVLETIEERSGATHRHYFASMKSAWANLPEAVAADYPTAEHFRKRLLIEAGFCDEQKIVFSNANDAIKAAGLVLARDDYAVAEAKDRTLTIWTAKSQSMRSMDKATFQASKEKTLELAAAKIGTSVEALSSQAVAAE